MWDGVKKDAERGRERGSAVGQAQNEHKSQRTQATLIEGTKLKPSCTTSSTTFCEQREREREGVRSRGRGRIILTTTFEARAEA